MATPAPTSIQAVINLRSFLNVQGATQPNCLTYNAPDSLTAQLANVVTIAIAPNTNNVEVALATLFPASLPVFTTLSDVSNPSLGFQWATETGGGEGPAGNYQTVRPGGFLGWTGDGLTAPTSLFVNNTDPSSTLYLQLGVLANATTAGGGGGGGGA
jgi:hypothetical protein